MWAPGTNATTGEHVDLSDLGLVGAQLGLVQAIKAIGKPTIVVFVSGKPIAEPWIQASLVKPLLLVFLIMLFSQRFSIDADAVIQQFYPGELGGKQIIYLTF